MEQTELIINGVKFNTENQVTLTFNDWKEVSDWWSANPKAYRIKPEINTTDIEEYNNINHNISFPAEMTFVFPEELN